MLSATVSASVGREVEALHAVMDMQARGKDSKEASPFAGDQVLGQDKGLGVDTPSRYRI